MYYVASYVRVLLSIKQVQLCKKQLFYNINCRTTEEIFLPITHITVNKWELLYIWWSSTKCALYWTFLWPKWNYNGVWWSSLRFALKQWVPVFTLDPYMAPSCLFILFPVSLPARPFGARRRYKASNERGGLCVCVSCTKSSHPFAEAMYFN